MASFIPQHDQPVSFQSLSLLDPSVLSEAISTLRNSLLHLESSNEQIAAFLRDSAAGEERLSEEERVEFEESVKENEWTMERQRERIEMMRCVLSDKLGIDAANSHYALAVPPSLSTISPSTTTTTTQRTYSRPPSNANGDEMEIATDAPSTIAPPDEGEDEGMYL